MNWRALSSNYTLEMEAEQDLKGSSSRRPPLSEFYCALPGFFGLCAACFLSHWIPPSHSFVAENVQSGKHTQWGKKPPKTISWKWLRATQAVDCGEVFALWNNLTFQAVIWFSTKKYFLRLQECFHLQIQMQRDIKLMELILQLNGSKYLLLSFKQTTSYTVWQCNSIWAAERTSKSAALWRCIFPQGDVYFAQLGELIIDNTPKITN